jgi:hypothetical protein
MWTLFSSLSPAEIERSKHYQITRVSQGEGSLGYAATGKRFAANGAGTRKSTSKANREAGNTQTGSSRQSLLGNLRPCHRATVHERYHAKGWQTDAFRLLD